MINDLEIVQWDYLLDPAFQLVNTAGKPLTNGWIEVYIHGTRDKYYCASDFNGTLHPFKIPLDSLGSNIVLASPANAYDIYVYNVYGSLVMSRYNVKPGSGSGSGVIPADASYGIFGTNELPMNNTSNTGFQFTAKDIGGDDITFHEITYPYGRIDCKEGVYFYSATIEVSNTETSNESVKFQVLAGKNPNQSVYWLDFDNTYLHKQLYTICGIANFVNEDTFRINVSPYQLTNGVKASASQVAIHKLSTVVAGEGGGGGHEYGAGWGILINNDEISVDPSIIPTIEYVDASVSAVSSTLISTIESVSGNLQDQIDNIPEQVQSDWEQDDDTEVDYIKNKPDLSVFATHDEVCAVSSVLQNEIDNIDLSEYVTHTELNSTVTAVSSVLENEIQIVSAAIPDVSDFVTHDEVSAVSSNLVEYVDNSINNVSGDLVEYIDNSVNTASGNLVQYIDDSITEVNETIENVSGNIINEVNETINNVSGDLVEYIDNSVGAVSGDIIEYVDNTVSETVNNVSAVIEGDIQIVSGVVDAVSAKVDEVSAKVDNIETQEVEFEELDVASLATKADVNSVSSVLETEIQIVSAAIPDVSDYATHQEVSGIVQVVSGDIINELNSVSSVIETQIQNVSGDIQNITNNLTVVSGNIEIVSGKLDVVSGKVDEVSAKVDGIQTEEVEFEELDVDNLATKVEIQTVSAAVDAISATMVSASGIEYGQFYSTGITTTPATMSRVKGTITVDNGRIQLKKGSSYHVTVRGRYNQTTAANTNTAVGYIEYVSNNTINVNVDKTLTDSQYFEISYDLFNLSNNVDYLVWFTGTDGGTVNDLWIEIHSLNGLGVGQGGGTGPGTEYTPGYGIQILNNVISVSGIAPQVQSDWAQDDNSEIDFIKNKPEEQALVAGDNINIQVSGSNVIISSTSDGEVTEQELAIVSGVLNSRINTVSGAAFKQSDWTEEDNTKVEFIKNKPTEYDLIGGQNVNVTVSGTNVIIDSTASGDVTHADLEAVSGALESQIQTVSAAIPEIELNSNNQVTAIDGHTLAGGGGGTTYTAGDYIDISNDTISVTGLDNSNIFWCVRNSTTFEEAKAAYDAGKKLMLISNGQVGTCMYVSSTQFGFMLPDNFTTSGPQFARISLTSGAGWNRWQAVYPNVQADWNTTNSSSQSYINNKPDLSVYSTNNNLSAVSGALHTEIQSVSSAIPEEMSLVAGDNIEIQVSGASAIISATGGEGDITRSEVSAVSAILQTEIQTVSGAVTSVSAAIPETEEVEFEEIDLADYALASAIPDVSNLATKTEVQTATNTLQGEIDAVSGKAVNADWTAVSGAAEILHKPDEYNLIAGTNVTITKQGNDVTISARGGGGGGSSYIAGTGIDIDANDVISVSGVAMASAVDVVSAAIDVVSGKLPTTEIGKFTIQNNVSGGPIEVIIPTDDAPVSAFYDLNAQYDDALSNRAGPSTYYYVFKSPGYDNDTWSANPGDGIQLKVKETIQGIGAIFGFYAYNSSPAGSNAPTINYPNNTPLVAGSGATYIVEAGLYTIGLGSNPAGSAYGKYITLMVNAGGSGIYVDDILDKIEFTIGRPNAALGTTVNLSRYYLGNTIYSSTPSSDMACQVTVDSASKQQTVYLPPQMPSSWTSRVAQYVQYGSNRFSSGLYYTSQQYIAYKYTSSPTRYQFAYCTDWDQTNRLMTFIAYDNSGNAIEKWTLDYSTYSSNVWTTTQLDYATEAELQAVSGAIPEEINLIPGSGITIEVSGASAVISSTGGGSTYTAGNMIDITNSAISVETTAGITDIQLVNSLPASPTSTVLYLIPES